ncbi:ATP-binding protein [Azovibrio restrictus]|uniref:ATP-binding protein n=1 Tax=Azovibrio restrictus TaxID=146938 RepID=UPI0026EF8C36|nr:ATP-binding protein [Azovibrio restrictus]
MTLPRSLLARIFLWVAALVIVTNLAWIMIFRLADAEPRARALAQFSASAVNLVRVALLTANPELRPALLQELSDREGIRLLPRDPHDQIAPLPGDGFMAHFQEQTRTLLGPETQLSLQVNQEPGLWISFALVPSEADEFWLILPLDRTERRIPWPWIGWGTLAAALALVVAWLIASRISRPLRHMAWAARQVGLGNTPPPLPEEGPEELQRLAGAFNRMSRDLAYHEKERAEILAGISHDLRTPLARLRLEAELSLPEGPAQAGMAADIAQMDAIIAQFLEYARGEAEERPEPCDPLPILEDLASHEEAIQRPLQLEAAPLPRIPLKARALRRALGNLVDNAWKYGAPPVRLQARVQGPWLELSVLDAGAGIPMAEVERLKRPFTRLETARSGATGTGLGLAIADRVARAHGGSLELTPGPDGKGLCATLRLPRTPMT